MMTARRMVKWLLGAGLLVAAAACSGPGFQPMSPYGYSGQPMSSPMLGGGG